MSTFLRSVAVSVVVGSVVLSACAEDAPKSRLQEVDFKKPEGDVGKFDRNNIIEAAEFSDSSTLDAKAIQDFLKLRNPYSRPSFLETYQSNGVRAADAIILAARQYQINPIVFLVYAQAAQGLIGERNYPFPPDRVEYVFRCGCLEMRDCLPTTPPHPDLARFAGFDRQLDCLGRSLRDAIDQIKGEDKKTAAGWAPDQTSTTLDNIKVSPKNESTAALYDRTPRVAQSKEGGTWMLWNIYNHYKLALEYSGPLGGADGKWIGEECKTSDMCSGAIGGEGAERICASPPEYPGGFCTVSCTGACPSVPGKTEAFCTKFSEGEAYCLPVCNPVASTCRPGYECKNSVGVGSGDQKHVCSPPEQK